jgi:hypothetical protein
MSIPALFRTTRPLSSLVTGTLAASAAIVGQGRLSIRGFSAGLAMTVLSMFGFAVNDILDYHEDRAAGIQRPLASGKISRKSAVWLAIVMLLAAFLFSLATGPGKGILVIISALLLLYSPLKKRHPLFKDIYIAGLCCLPMYYGAIVGGRKYSWLSYSALVWIDWRGPYNRQAAYYNGSAVPIREIDDHKIALADGDIVLSLEKEATLREGLLGATALSMLPNLNRLFPARILKVREQKWLSRGVLRQPGRPDSAGMAIHEVVEWP